MYKPDDIGTVFLENITYVNTVFWNSTELTYLLTNSKNEVIILTFEEYKIAIDAAYDYIVKIKEYNKDFNKLISGETK